MVRVTAIRNRAAWVSQFLTFKGYGSHVETCWRGTSSDEDVVDSYERRTVCETCRLHVRTATSQYHTPTHSSPLVQVRYDPVWYCCVSGWIIPQSVTCHNHGRVHKRCTALLSVLCDDRCMDGLGYNPLSPPLPAEIPHPNTPDYHYGLHVK